MQISAPAPPAAAVANQQASNFAKLGATRVGVSDAGIDLDFASPEAANVAHAVMRDEIQVHGSNGSVAVPVRVNGLSSAAASVGLADAARAIRELDFVVSTFRGNDGVARVIAFSNVVDSLRALLRPEIAGVQFEPVALIPPGGTGWGSGVGSNI